MIAKYGIPNIEFKHCSRETKGNVIRSYCRSIGWKKHDYSIAIGIRADEIDRISDKAEEENIYYPLIKTGITKPFINRFWAKQPFRLNLKGYEGNCKVCWKKSLRKHLTIAKEHPEHFNNFERWEEKYGNFIPETRVNANPDLPIRFFRNNLSCADIKKLSEQPFELAKDDSKITTEIVQLGLFDIPLDLSNGCVESCEPF